MTKTIGISMANRSILRHTNHNSVKFRYPISNASVVARIMLTCRLLMTPDASDDNLVATFVAPSLKPSLISYRLGVWADRDPLEPAAVWPSPKYSEDEIEFDPSNRDRFARVSNYGCQGEA